MPHVLVLGKCWWWTRLSASMVVFFKNHLGADSCEKSRANFLYGCIMGRYSWGDASWLYTPEGYPHHSSIYCNDTSKLPLPYQQRSQSSISCSLKTAIHLCFLLFFHALVLWTSVIPLSCYLHQQMHSKVKYTFYKMKVRLCLIKIYYDLFLLFGFAILWGSPIPNGFLPSQIT